jgi:hypothetical protein
MRLARAQSSGSETLSLIRSSAGCTIDMHESDFSEATEMIALLRRGRSIPLQRCQIVENPICTFLGQPIVDYINAFN